MVQKVRPQAETLSGSPQPNFVGYAAAPVVAKRAPTTSDTGYSIGQLWVDKVGNNSYQLTSVSAGAATWAELGGVSGPIDSLSGDSGSATPSAGVVTIAGTSNQITTAGSSHTVTLSLPSALTAPGSVTATTTLTATAGAITATNGNVVLGTAGNKLSIATGANASIGTATLGGGVATVSTSAVTASSKIFLSVATAGGTPGILSISSIIAGTNFGISSSDAGDSSTVNWLIIN